MVLERLANGLWGGAEKVPDDGNNEEEEKERAESPEETAVKEVLLPFRCVHQGI